MTSGAVTVTMWTEPDWAGMVVSSWVVLWTTEAAELILAMMVADVLDTMVDTGAMEMVADAVRAGNVAIDTEEEKTSEAVDSSWLVTSTIDDAEVSSTTRELVATTAPTVVEVAWTLFVDEAEEATTTGVEAVPDKGKLLDA